MEGKVNEISTRLKAAKTPSDFERLLDEVNKLIELERNNKSLLHIKAELNIKLQKPAEAINNYNAILKLDPEDQVAGFQIEHLKTILKFNNTDIYANPNTNLDPWLD